MDIRLIDANALLDNIPKDTELLRYQVVGPIRDMPTITLNDLRDDIYLDAVKHGLWESYNYTVAQCIEKAERNGDPFDDPESVRRSWAMEPIRKEVNELEMASESEEEYVEELADVIIMSFSVAGKLGIDIDAAIRRKMEINRGRSWKHEND